jgi:hypothetical protein
MNKIVVRLEKGETEYEGRSFSKSPDLLLDEIEEELLDVAGWSFIMWQRISDIRGQLSNLPPEKESIVRRGVAALETIASSVKSKLGTNDYVVTYTKPFSEDFQSILGTIIGEDDDDS